MENKANEKATDVLRVAKDPHKPQKESLNTDGMHETKYCKILQAVRMDDKEGLGYTYALEKLFIKEREREELRICLYKDMRDRSGMISNRMLVRPVDLTELEIIDLFQKAYKENIFSDEFKKYMRNIFSEK